MDLLGLIGGPAPGSTGGGAKAPTPGPEGGLGAFGAVVADNRQQRPAQDGAGDAGAGPGDPPEAAPVQRPEPMPQMADRPAGGLIVGAHPGLRAAAIVATVEYRLH
ncbi:MAG: hypothetical protein ACE5EU_15730 [Paracoccaceae bacterium]